MDETKNARRRRAVIVFALALALIVAAAFAIVPLLRVGADIGAPSELGDERYGVTAWEIRASYPHDALAFLNLITLDPYFSQFYPEGGGERWRTLMSRAERRAVDRLYFWIRGRFNATLSSLAAYFYDASGAEGLSEFRELLRDPAALMRACRRDLDLLSYQVLGGWRVPRFVFSMLCRDLGSYLDFLSRAGFEAAWRAEREPTLAELARRYEAEMSAYNVVGAVERALGGGLPGPKVTVLLGSYLRPNGISLGRNRFLMEDRVDAVELAAVAAHELIHGYADWSSPGLRGIPPLLSRDRLAARRYKERDTGYNYNSWPVIAEEAWTKALDQLAQEELFPALAPDPVERFWFHDGGLHASALLFYRLLKGELGARAGGGAADGPAAERLAAAFAAGRIPEGAVEAAWAEALGADRLGRLPPEPRLRRVHDAGDPALDAMHPSYNEALPPGGFVVFLADWYGYEGSARDSLKVLDELGRAWDGRALVDPATGLERRGRYLFAGNVSTERDGKAWYYRNALYFRALD